MSFMSSFVLTLPEVILSAGAIALMMVAAFAGDKAEGLCRWVAIALLAAAGMASFHHAGEAFDGLYRADDFSLYAKLLIYVAAAVSLMLSPRFFSHEDRPRAEYPVLILLATVGMGMMVSAVDLLTLYVGIELNSLSAYVLASFIRKDERAAEAGLKYFVLGALASGILLYGMSLLYGFSGTTHYAGLAKAMADGVNTGELFGLVFVMAGLAFKISAVPFHMWTPDVYEGAPTPVTTFFASAPKVAGMAMLARMTTVALGPAAAQWQQILIFMALASVILGAVGAMGQTNIKRLLAYSSINNVGFALVGLASGTPDGVSATMTYMAVYVVMTLGSFACVLHMRDADGHYVEDIASLSGLSRNNKALAAGFAILMFSLAGIPPLLGFWPKLLVFFAATKAGLFPLAVIAALGSVVGAYYYLKIIKTMYFDEPAPAYAPAQSYVEAGVVAVSAVLLVGGYLLIPVLSAASAAAAGALFCNGQIRTVPQTGSTNADLLDAARAGAPDGVWLRADRQSGGKGRMGRAWESPAGNFYGSHLVRLRPADPPAPSLAFVAAVALCEVLMAQAPLVPFMIKWPNDILIGPAKMCGILLERTEDAVVIGIGVNLAHHPEAMPRAVTCLAAQGVTPLSPAAFLGDLAPHFAHWLGVWRTDGMAAVIRRWEALAHPRATPLSVSLPDGTQLDGAFDGLSADGALCLRLADGRIRAIHAGDVFLV